MSRTDSTQISPCGARPKTPKASPKSSAGPEILRRALDFEFDAQAVPKAWYGDDLHLSLFMDGLSLVFPKGEQFFVNSVKFYKAQIEDPQLLDQVIGFIGQESMHGKEHRAFNQMVEAHGLSNAPALEAKVSRILARAQRRLPPIVQLAVTCGLEHFTAILGEQLLSEPRHHAAIHEKVRPLWLWHALEESEHKSVAFDVFRAVGGRYPIRVGTMLVTSVIFVAVASEVHVRLVHQAGELYRPKQWLKTFGFFWVKPGLFRKLVLPYLDYFRPDFHPSDRDTDALLASWEERLFGAEGELRAVFKGAYNAAGEQVTAAQPA